MILSGKKFSGLLLLLFLFSWNVTLAQVKGRSYLEWYSWNTSGGLMMPSDFFRASLGDGIRHAYRFDGVPGFVFSVAKPLGLQLNIGAELEDQLDKGALTGYRGFAADTLYNIRTRTYSLFAQYYLTPNMDINPFVMGKVGYGGINRARTTVDLSRTTPANRWNFFVTAATGVTWNATANISFNLYGEISAIPSRYLRGVFKDLPPGMSRYVYSSKVVLTVTSHTDIRVFYPYRKGGTFKPPKYKQQKYLPYSRQRVRK